jgi:hypothetical protein
MTVNTERITAAWRSALAAVFALAVALAPVLAFAQGSPGGGGGGGTGSGGAPSAPMGGTGGPGGPPGGPGGGGGGGGSGLAWIVVILAIAVAIWLFTRRRGGRVNR